MNGLYVLQGESRRVSFHKLTDDLMIIYSTVEGTVDGRKDVEIAIGRNAYSILLKRGYKRVRPNRAEEYRHQQEMEDYVEFMMMQKEGEAEDAWLRKAEYDPEAQDQMYLDDQRCL